VQAEWFGASTTASAATNTAAINAALLVGPTYLTKAGSYAFGETGSTGVAFTMATNAQFYSNPAIVTLVAAAGTYTTFNVTGSYTRVIGIQIDNTLKTAGYDHKIVCGTGAIIETYFDDFLIFKSPGIFTDSGSGSGIHYRTYIGAGVGGKATMQRGPGIVWARGFAFLRLGSTGSPSNFAIDYLGSSSANHIGVDIAMTGLPAGAGGLYCSITVIGVGTTSSQKGFVFTDCAAMKMAGSTADSTYGQGFLFDGCAVMDISDIGAGLCNDHCIRLLDCSVVEGVCVRAVGGKILTAPVAAKDGIRFEGTTTSVNLGTVSVYDCTGDGLSAVGTGWSYLFITGLYSKSNTGRGIKSDAGTSISVVGGALVDNTAGNFDLGGSTDHMRSVVLNSGAIGNPDGPATG
jgi:hypothetical protein